MNRITYTVMRNIFRAPWWLYHIWKMGRDGDRHTQEERYAYLKDVVGKVNKTGRVIVTGYGTEHIPEQDGFVLFPNHQGLFDMLAIIDTCQRPLSVVVKKEVCNVILVKQVVELLKAIPMDRKDIRESMRIINQMTEDVKNGKNYVIFPEGTRSRDGNQILKFKGGTFKSAVNARCPIVPVALIDSYKPFGLPSIRKENVQVHYLEPIPYEQYLGLKTVEIADIVHDRIQQKINENISENMLDNTKLL